MKANFEIIDAHIHPFIYEKSNMKWFDSPTSHKDFFEDLTLAGISRSCGSVIRCLKKPSFANIKDLNKEAIELKNLYPDLYIPGINVHGDFPQESCEEIEKLYKEENICWLGELVAYMMDYQNYASENMFQVYELAQDLDLTVNIHPYGLEEIEKYLSKFPKIKHRACASDFRSGFNQGTLCFY